MSKSVNNDMGFAAQVIGISILMLKEKYTDQQIVNMFKMKKVKKMVEIIGSDKDGC